MIEILQWPAAKRRAVLYTEWLNGHIKGVSSLLDIGAADAVVSKHLPDGVKYFGVDIGADIYSRDNLVSYIEDYDELKRFVSAHEPIDATIILDVLEHTPEFTELFRLAAKRTQKYIFVTLPNEMCLLARWQFLFGKPVACHGLNMVGTKPGHKHLWLVKVADAREALGETAKEENFELCSEVHIMPEPKNPLKRVAYRALSGIMPSDLGSVGFGLLYKRKS